VKPFGGYKCEAGHDPKHYAFDLSGAVTCLVCLMTPKPNPAAEAEQKLRAAGFYQLWRDPTTELLYRSAEGALEVLNFRLKEKKFAEQYGEYAPSAERKP
jgi:hypothetical protein